MNNPAQTVEAPKRGRGRPLGEVPAMTPAERQKLRRERLKASGVGVLTVELPGDILAAIHKFVEFKDLTINEVVARVLRDRLLRKR